MIGNGDDLDDGQQEFAVEHDLLAVVIEEAEEVDALREEEEKEEEEANEEARLRELEEEEEKDRLLIAAGGSPGPEDELGEEGPAAADQEGTLALMDSDAPKKKKERPKGSNGRPKVPRKGRRKTEDGKAVDRPAPSTPAPTSVAVVEGHDPRKLFDGKGRPLKKVKSTRSMTGSRRSSRRGSLDIDKALEEAGGGSRRLSRTWSRRASSQISPGGNFGLLETTGGSPVIMEEKKVLELEGGTMFTPVEVKEKEMEVQERMRREMEEDELLK